MSRPFQHPAPILSILMIFACSARPSDDRQPEATKASPPRATQPEVKPEVKPEAKPAPSGLADAAAPPVPLEQVRGLSVVAGKLRIEVPIDDPVLGMKSLAGLHAKFKATDGISKKVDPTAAGIPDGFHEGDSWVVLTEKGAELVTVTGLGFPAGGESKRAWLVLRDEPNEEASGLAWPGAELPAGLVMTAAPPASSPDDATLQRVVAALEPAATRPRHAPTPEFIGVTSGRFGRGHTQLVVLSPPSLSASERDNFSPTQHLAWTLGAADGPPPAITRIYQSAHDLPLTVRALIDWNGDGTHDAALFNQHDEDDNSDYPTLVAWPSAGPQARMLVTYGL